MYTCVVQLKVGSFSLTVDCRFCFIWKWKKNKYTSDGPLYSSILSVYLVWSIHYEEINTYPFWYINKTRNKVKGFSYIMTWLSYCLYNNTLISCFDLTLHHYSSIFIYSIQPKFTHVHSCYTCFMLSCPSSFRLYEYDAFIFITLH